jgi:hypothetical protein
MESAFCETTMAKVKATYWNKGRLHELDYARRLDEFIV